MLAWVVIDRPHLRHSTPLPSSLRTLCLCVKFSDSFPPSFPLVFHLPYLLPSSLFRNPFVPILELSMATSPILLNQLAWWCRSLCPLFALRVLCDLCVKSFFAFSFNFQLSTVNLLCAVLPQVTSHGLRVTVPHK